MNAPFERPSDAEAKASTLSDGLSVSQIPTPPRNLDALPVGARLILRCRKDWREAIVAARSPEHITLLVCAPRGSTYRVKRPPDTPLCEDGPVPVLGEGSWRAGLVRYDVRW